VEVRVNPDGIEIVSYPGPDASIRVEALNCDRIVARRYRNRRIGDFLKELDLTEGRCTGIPTIRRAMAENGSPPAKFSTDEGRTYFLAELPIHPQMLKGKKAHDEVHDKVHDAEVDKSHVESIHGLTKIEVRLIESLAGGPRSRVELPNISALRAEAVYLFKAIDRLRAIDFIELTIPEKPKSKNQRMRLHPKLRCG